MEPLEGNVKQNYDWKVVLNQYSELLDLLADRRRHAMKSARYTHLAGMKPIPALSQIFKAWPSHVISDRNAIHACGNKSDLIRQLQLEMVVIYRNELPPASLILKAFIKLQSLGHTSLRELKENKLTCWSTSERQHLAEALGWLLKHGFAEIAQS